MRDRLNYNNSDKKIDVFMTKRHVKILYLIFDF
jgi:hypothetical protein